ncbi:Atg45p [Lachancea thermotolerans CBS 6340]|uniref:KLTH0E04422p n=1 Tax=Lachancea thermotolerans (strain ATCC 56472 / CBS 6340 / NRRL Y-8284) TaxID=559295 RepID=C5DHH7_LACTC|nr:KLTH0E04422p [Lachancea thermotolerans CBS 6340]CAR23238.1 KLTH0E04422p [Lachancea thermotolerans CBS 6340]
MTLKQLRIPNYALGDISQKDKVIVTGNFDNWEHTKFVLKRNSEDDSFEVEVPAVSSGVLTFKFVINDRDWVTLPYFDTEKDGNGFLNNVLKWQDADDERLEDITISSTIHSQNNSPQDQCVHVTTAGCENLADHDYIQVSSQDELSSTENVDLVVHCSSSSVGHENNREPSHEQSPDGDASQRRLQSLVSVVKRVKMYWSG